MTRHPWRRSLLGVKTTEIARWFGVGEDDVAVLISDYLAIDLHDEHIPPPLVHELRNILEPNRERTDFDSFWT